MSEKQEQTPPLGAGCDLDIQIARKLGYVWTTKVGGLGYEISRWTDPKTGDDAYPGCEWDQPAYSTSWEAAGELVEHIKEKVSKYIRIDCYPEKWIVLIKDPADHFSRQLSSGRAATAPLAICRAFLALPDFEVRQ